MKLTILLTLPALLLLGACGASDDSGGPSSTATSSADAPDQAAGAAFFKGTCVPCHGETGRGDGAASASLVPKPRDLSDKTWQAEVDDDYLRKVIQYGGVAVGKSAAMPANPLLNDKKSVLGGLVLHIRGLVR